MDVAAAAQYLPLRHARIGRVGESGMLPPGWRVEHLDGIRILDIGFRGQPWITLELQFAESMPGDYAGVGLGHYLPAPKGALVSLSAEITVAAAENIEAAFLVLREWRHGGVFVAQSIAAAPMDKPGQCAISRPMSDEDNLAEAVLLLRRRKHAAGKTMITLRGLAFGDLSQNADGQAPVAGTI